MVSVVCMKNLPFKEICLGLVEQTELTPHEAQLCYLCQPITGAKTSLD